MAYRPHKNRVHNPNMGVDYVQTITWGFNGTVASAVFTGEGEGALDQPFNIFCTIPGRPWAQERDNRQRIAIVNSEPCYSMEEFQEFVIARWGQYPIVEEEGE